MHRATSRLWRAGVVLGAVLLAAASSCGGDDSGTGTAAGLSCPAVASAPLTLVVGARANSAVPSLPAELVGRLSDSIRAQRRITVIRLDGNPQPVFDETPAFVAQNGTALDDEVADFIDKVTAAFAGPAHAVVPEADVLSALSFASRTSTPQSTIAVLDSGLQTAAPLDFRKDDLLLADPGETVDYLRKQNLLPDLAGRSLVFAGLGDTAPPQAHLDDRLRRNLTGIWQAIGKAGGACVDTMPVGAKEESVTGAPAVGTVPLPQAPPPPPRCGDIVLNEQNNVGFEMNTTVFRDGGAARTEIGGIVDQARDGRQRIDILGTTARWGTRESQVDLAHRRADAVRDVMVEAGIAADRITTSGVGSYSPYYIPDGGPDRLDPGPAAQNRRVIVRLICP